MIMSKKNFPNEIWGSGYSIRNGLPNGWHNSNMLVARKLKDGKIKWNDVYNYSKSAGTPWVRCPSSLDASRLINYLQSEGIYPKGQLNSVKNGNTQKLILLTVLEEPSTGEEIPVYVASGDYDPTNLKWYLDKETGDIKSFARDNSTKFKNLKSLNKKYRVSEDALKKYILNKVWKVLISQLDDFISDLTKTNYKYHTDPYINVNSHKYALSDAYISKYKIKKDNELDFNVEFSLTFSVMDLENQGIYEDDIESKLKSLSFASDSWVDTRHCGRVDIEYGEFFIVETASFKGVVIDDSFNEEDLEKAIDQVQTNCYDILSNELKEEWEKEIWPNSLPEFAKDIDNALNSMISDTTLESLSEEIKDNHEVWSKDGLRGYRLSDVRKEREEFLDSLDLAYPKTPNDYSYCDSNAEEGQYHFILAKPTTRREGFLIEIDNHNEIIGLFALNSVSAKMLNDWYEPLVSPFLEFPELYDFIKDINLTIVTQFGESLDDLIEEFRDRFKGEDYEQAYLLYKGYERLGKDLEPFDYDGNELDNLKHMLHDSESMIDDLRAVSEDENVDEELKEQANKLYKIASKVLLKDQFLEKKL